MLLRLFRITSSVYHYSSLYHLKSYLYRQPFLQLSELPHPLLMDLFLTAAGLLFLDAFPHFDTPPFFLHHVLCHILSDRHPVLKYKTPSPGSGHTDHIQMSSLPCPGDRSLSEDIASVFPKAPVFPENSKTRIPSHPDSRKCTPAASESDPDSKKTFHFGDNTDRYHCTTDMPSYNLVCFFLITRKAKACHEPNNNKCTDYPHIEAAMAQFPQPHYAEAS